MLTLIQLLTTLLPLLYALAAANYTVYFLRLEPFAQRTTTPFLFGTFLLHVGYMLLRALYYQRHPIVGWAELLTVITLAMAGVYLYVERLKQNKMTGAFIIALVAVLQLAASTLMPEVAQVKNDLPASALFGLHTIVAMLGYTAFFVGVVYGLMFLMLDRALKQKRFGIIFERLPALEELADMGFWATFLGWVFLTATILLGVVMSFNTYPGFYKDPKVLSTVAVWTIYGAVVLARFALKWRGARSVYLSLAGFIIAVVATAAAHVLGETFHSFLA
jgi:HemX protein